MNCPLRNAHGGTLVLGGGFAGAYVARGLGRQGATIVNPANFMLYTPLLPEAAAGSIEPRHVTAQQLEASTNWQYAEKRI